MKHNILEENLKKLRDYILPDEKYSRESLATILQSRHITAEPDLFPNFVFRFGFILIIVAVTISIALKNDVPLKIAGLDIQSLKAEAEELKIQLRLAEIDAQQKTIEAAIKETINKNPGQLSTSLLKKEAHGLNLDENTNQTIDAALEELAN